ncbi:Cell division and transport-associated protein TolA [Marinomonas polaris DSM 16579]|uniref:Cell division and transport-associated protein TolA n=1 Tax=Marinomonas polaris DSM 16579 TaxID=1122206 RepID=A0A1M4ZQY6_9GAMM|nr:cell envelope integrity protein TolA [Marinomonas polaris]SHF20217.1 Cell division and transport-associated protein TolA [Marinomonas polaris DSM 16579]
MKWLRSDNYSIPTVLAIGLHVGIVVAGFVAIDFSDNEIPKPKRPPIVNATVVDVSQTIIGKRESDEKAAKQQAAALAEKKKSEAEQARKKEAQRKALEEKQKQLAQAKQAKDKAEAEKQETERKQKAAEQKRTAQEAESKRLAQEQADKKRLAEKEASEKKKQELARKAEADRVAEEERKRQEEAAKLAEKKKAEEAAAKAAAEEAMQRAADEAQMVQSISGLINDRVTAAWIRPPSARNNMKAQLRIYFLPNGEVMNAQITKSSGDALFDQRAVDAVYKVRKIEELSKVDSYVFERNFRQVDLIFNPQDLRN